MESPVNSKFEDRGLFSHTGFSYQSMYIAILAIQMYNQKLLWNELFCEHHEDVLAHLNDGKFLGIQIKTQDAKYGKYKLSKTKDISSSF